MPAAANGGPIPGWMLTVTFLAWIVAIFVPLPFVPGDRAALVTGVFTSMLGLPIGLKIARALKGDA